MGSLFSSSGIEPFSVVAVARSACCKICWPQQGRDGRLTGALPAAQAVAVSIGAQLYRMSIHT